MCPMCLNSAAMIVIGATTTGGLITLAIKNPLRLLSVKSGANSTKRKDK